MACDLVQIDKSTCNDRVAHKAKRQHLLAANNDDHAEEDDEANAEDDHAEEDDEANYPSISFWHLHISLSLFSQKFEFWSTVLATSKGNLTRIRIIKSVICTTLMWLN